MSNVTATQTNIGIDQQVLKQRARAAKIKRMNRDKWLYLLMVPGILYYIIFKFAPMYGIIIAFQDYSPFLGMDGSPWVGFKHFTTFFSNPDFPRLMGNTLILSFLTIVFAFPAPILIALMLNEIRKEFYKKFIQTLVYIPHFVSMVIIASITYVLLNTEGGPINQILMNTMGNKIDFLGSPNWFRPLIIVQTIWKECGWGTIIFLAALSGVDVQLYEAAVVDGAGRLRQLWHITLPAIRSTIVILLIMRMGSVLSNGFEHIFLMTNSLNREVADVFDTFVYTLGVTRGAYSYSTAVNLFKSLISLVLILSTDKIAKKCGEAGLF
jgi:putative aldouronate transport system permease protein